MRAGRLALALAAAVLGTACVIYDGTAEVRLLPEGPLEASAVPLVLYVETEARGEARLLVDGVEAERAPPLNRPFELDPAELADGPHTVQVQVHDGAHLRESNVVRVDVSRVSPAGG